MAIRRDVLLGTVVGKGNTAMVCPGFRGMDAINKVGGEIRQAERFREPQRDVWQEFGSARSEQNPKRKVLKLRTSCQTPLLWEEPLNNSGSKQKLKTEWQFRN